MVGVVNNQIKKDLLLSVRMKFFKSVNIWQSYKQERGCLMHFAHLANTLKYSPILIFLLTDSEINLSLVGH